MSPQGLALALLRENASPVQPKEIAEYVAQTLGENNVNLRSVYNVGPRLQKEGLIEKSSDGWELTDPSRAPVVHEGHAWGSQSVFTRQEIAAYRRELILGLLRRSADGLLAMQITRELEKSEFCKVTANKDVVKLDLQALVAEKKIKRHGRKYSTAIE